MFEEEVKFLKSRREENKIEYVLVIWFVGLKHCKIRMIILCAEKDSQKYLLDANDRLEF